MPPVPRRSCKCASSKAKSSAFARAITHGLSNGYLSVVVVGTCRGQGIGKALVEQIISSDPNMTWVLRASGKA